jgi:signal transduction histidine kinase
MNGMLARLEESQAVQRRFVSDASHELKSPLASLRQYAEVARAHPDRISSRS